MTKRISSTFLAVALAAAPITLATACGGGTDDLSPAELGRLGARIYEAPERAESILDEAGLERDELEERIAEVTADPDEAEAYTEAFRAELGS